jgi:hypothetical protein
VKVKVNRSALPGCGLGVHNSTDANSQLSVADGDTVKDITTANARVCMFDEWRARPVEEGASTEETVSVPGTPGQFAGADAVRYATRFEDPRGPNDDVAVLHLHGLYAHSEVEVTGQRLDGEGAVSHDAYFDPLRIPFEPFEENELAVTCRRPRDRFGGLYDTETVPEDAAVPGIWWDATLESHPLPYVDSIDVRPEVTDDGAVLHVQTTVVTDGPLEGRITYSLKPEGNLKTRGMMNRGRFEARGPGRTTVEHTIDVRDPALWWPRDLGDQNRYRLRAKLADSERSVTTGICDISRVDNHLVVNGDPLPIRGVNLLTASEEDVERALGVNANLVRAHAHVPPHSLYDACDQTGLLVWQDLPLTGPGAFDTDRGRQLAETISGTYSQHPSLAAYGVHDEPVEMVGDGGLGAGLVDGLRLRWRAWRNEYDHGPANTVAETLPGNRPVFPVIGEPGTDADAGAYYPGWDYGQPESIDTLLDRYPVPVVAEFGAGAFGPETVESAAGFNRTKHDRRADDETSQSHQATVLRTVTERLRCRGVGAVAFALRDTDAAGMGLFGADGQPKTARDTLASAFEPRQVFLADPSPGTSEVIVVNDRPQELSTTVHWEAGPEGGEFDATVGAAGRWTGGPIRVPGDADCVVLSLSDQNVEHTYQL